MNKSVIIGIAFVIVAGSAFFGGMKYSTAQQAAARAARTGGMSAGRGMRFGGGGPGGGGFTNGEIIAKDDKSITIKLADGGSKIVFLSGTSKVMKAVDGSLADLAIGTNVSANGSANSDGSITAQFVQIRPAGFAMASSTQK